MTSTSPDAVTFMKVAEVAEALRVSKMTVYRLVHSGELPSVKVGGGYRISQAAFRAYLEGTAFIPHGD